MSEDISRRCIIMDDETGQQCEDHHGHKGRHWIMWKKKYFEDTGSRFEEDEGV